MSTEHSSEHVDSLPSAAAAAQVGESPALLPPKIEPDDAALGEADADGVHSEGLQADLRAVVEKIDGEPGSGDGRYVLLRETRPSAVDGDVGEIGGSVESDIPAIASKIRTLVDGVNAREVEDLFAVAKLVHDAQQSGSYGERVVEELAKELSDLGLSAKTLSNYAAVAAAYSPEEFEALMKRTSPGARKPFHLTWSHAVFLADKHLGGDDPFVQKVFDERLNSKATREAWNEAHESRSSHETVPQSNEGDECETLEATTVGPLATATAKVKDLLSWQALVMEDLAEFEAAPSIPYAQLAELSDLDAVLGDLSEMSAAVRAKASALVAKHSQGADEHEEMEGADVITLPLTTPLSGPAED